MQNILDSMKSVSRIFIKIKEEEIEPFLTCYLNFVNPLKNFQSAVDSRCFCWESVNKSIKNLQFRDDYTYYGENSNILMEDSCPFKTGSDLQVIAIIQRRLVNTHMSHADLVVSIAPVWLETNEHSSRYLLVNQSRRKYLEYVVHIRRSPSECIWYRYVKNIIDYAVETDIVSSCKFIYG